MPFVHIRLSGFRIDDECLIQLQEDSTHLVATVLRKKRDLTAVLVEQYPPSAWSIGGCQVPAAAHLEVTVTKGTNTEEEKAIFISQATLLLAAITEQRLPIATYVVIREVAASSWGYDGRTQENRKLSSAA